MGQDIAIKDLEKRIEAAGGAQVFFDDLMHSYALLLGANMVAIDNLKNVTLSIVLPPTQKMQIAATIEGTALANVSAMKFLEKYGIDFTEGTT